MKKRKHNLIDHINSHKTDGIKSHPLFVCSIILILVFLIWTIEIVYTKHRDLEMLRVQQQELELQKEQSKVMAAYERTLAIWGESAQELYIESDVIVEDEYPVILTQYQSLHEENTDLIGWLRIEGTIIDYPVMQTLGDENFYLDKDFHRNENSNGSLIMDTDSCVGIGKAENDYQNGMKPSTNLIIHGHNMKSGEMFGYLQKYEDEAYGKQHAIIRFDSLYEEREYELIAVFYSQVFNKTDEVFKYYKFFQADTQEEFNDWYTNIKAMSIYDTQVTASFGDEFITLSTCSYHVDEGRFVVVAKRIR